MAFFFAFSSRLAKSSPSSAASPFAQLAAKLRFGPCAAKEPIARACSQSGPKPLPALSARNRRNRRYRWGQAKGDALVQEHFLLEDGPLAAQVGDDLGNDVFWG